MAQYTSTHTGLQIDSAVEKMLNVNATAAELNTLDGITASTTELNYVDGVTSNIQTQLNGKQNTLVSGTNIKSINNQSIVGSGNLTLDTGKVDDIKANGTSILSNKEVNLMFNTTYDASTNKIATMADISSAIGEIEEALAAI